MKRLDRGRFVWPSASDGAISISAAQLAYLVEGIDWRPTANVASGRRRIAKIHAAPDGCYLIGL